MLARRTALLGADSAPVATAHNELASVLQDSGHLAEAITHYRAALAIDERVQGRQAVPTAVNLNNLATALEDAGDPAAEAAYRESLAIRSARLQPDDPSVARARHNLGRWLLRQGRPGEARQHWQAVAPALEALPPGAPLRLQAEALRRQLAR